MYQLEWPKSRILTILNLDEIWSNRNSHSLLVQMQNGSATLEDSLAISYKIKHFQYSPGIMYLDIIQMKWKHMSTLKLVHKYP